MAGSRAKAELQVLQQAPAGTAQRRLEGHRRAPPGHTRSPARLARLRRGAVYGLAIDLGSTTIAAHLCDLTTARCWPPPGIMNPQIRFGEDLMSRVSYAMMNPGGDREMTAAVREALNKLAGRIATEAGIDPTGSSRPPSSATR